jgi:hypothetical protein
MALKIIMSSMAIILSIPNVQTMWCGSLMGLSHERGWINQLKISAPLPVKETYRLIPLLAKLISLGSPFNRYVESKAHM